MKIKELHLINFGKFTNKLIKLDHKMTIIYGENEAGKSTIFNFIVGMFYGFYKPYVKNRRLLDIHETYKPWSGGGYRGSLLFYDEESEKDLRLERNFTQGQEEVKVIVEETAEDITESYDIHAIFRLPDVAAKHIGVSYATFINTLAIKQLGHETDENLDRELKETVVNALSTHNIDVSVNKVQDKITKELNAIGSSRRKTSSYYLKKQKIVLLESELDNSKEIHREIIRAKDETDDLNNLKQEALLSLEKIEVIESFKKLCGQEDIVNQGKDISKDMNTLEEKQKELNISDEFTLVEIEEAIEEYNHSDFIGNQIENSNKSIHDNELEIGQLKSDMIKPKTTITDADLEKITKDMYTCHQLIEEENESKREMESLQLEVEKFSRKLETLETKKQTKNKRKKLGMVILLGSIVFIVLSMVLMSKVATSILAIIIGSVGFIIGMSLYLMSHQKMAKYNNDLKQCKNDIMKVQDLTKTQKTLSDKKNKHKIKIFQYYNVEDIPSLTSLKDRWLKDVMAEASTSKIYENQLVGLEKLRHKKAEMIKGKENLISKLSHIENKLRPMTSYYQINNIDDLKKVKSRLVQFLDLTNRITNGKIRLRDILKVQSFEKALSDLEEARLNFEKALEGLKKKSKIDEKCLLSDEANDILKSKPSIIEQINKLDQNIAAITSKNEALSRGHRRVSEIEEELVTEKKGLETLDFNKKVYEMIGHTIETITDELQHNFAPLLNESVTKMVETITAHKYSDIKINPQMLMRLKDPHTHQMINANQLSRGTMDLFYLALRDALTSWINGDKQVPVLLDETFAHFDDVRLEAALELFSKSERQVILFTCQKREVDLVNELEFITAIYL